MTLPMWGLFGRAAFGLLGAAAIAHFFKRQKRDWALSFYQGKTVWVTGASQGIGREMCVALSKLGVANLIISSRNSKKLQQVREACSSSADPSPRIIALPLDLAEMANGDSAEKVVKKALEECGANSKNGSRVDVLINNGGVSVRGLATETKLSVDQHVMNVNFFGTVALTKAVLPFMLKQEAGAICVVSSLQGKFGTPARSAYAASKHALHGFFDSLRLEVEPKGVSVTVACPGYVRTNLSLNALRGDGTLHGSMDANTAKGMDPKYVAERILKATALQTPEVSIASLYHSLAIPLNTLAPSLLRYMLRRKYAKESALEETKNSTN